VLNVVLVGQFAEYEAEEYAKRHYTQMISGNRSHCVKVYEALLLSTRTMIIKLQDYRDKKKLVRVSPAKLERASKLYLFQSGMRQLFGAGNSRVITKLTRIH
jgi:hypothetical protein